MKYDDITRSIKRTDRVKLKNMSEREVYDFIKFSKMEKIKYIIILQVHQFTSKVKLMNLIK